MCQTHTYSVDTTTCQYTTTKGTKYMSVSAASGYKGTQIFSFFGSTPKSSAGTGTPPSSVIGSTSLWQTFTIPSAGTYTVTAQRSTSGNVCAAAFSANPINTTPATFNDLMLLGEASSYGSATVSFTTSVSNQVVYFAVDSFDGNVDYFTIPNPVGTVQTPVGAKVVYSGVDYFQPTCGTSGATILYKQSSSTTWLTYSSPVSMAAVPDKTYFDIMAVKQDYNKSSVASWRYMAS